jgi:hypothetical protein
MRPTPRAKMKHVQKFASRELSPATPTVTNTIPMTYRQITANAAALFLSASQSGALKFAWHFGQEIRCPNRFASSTVRNPQKGQEIGPRVATAVVGGGLGKRGLVQIDSFSGAGCGRGGAFAAMSFKVSDSGMLSTKRCPQVQQISCPTFSSPAASDLEQLGHATVNIGNPRSRQSPRMRAQSADFKA